MSVIPSFGQLHAWRTMERIPPALRHDANLARSWDLPTGLRLPEVRDALRRMVTRHEVLRSVYECPEPGGALRQHILPELEDLPLDLVEIDDASRQQPWDVRAARRAKTFDPTTGAAWRATVELLQGRPVRIGFVSHHAVADAWALDLLGSELLALLAPGGPVRGTFPDSPLQPRELALTQRSDAWQARRRSAASYRRNLLKNLNSDHFSKLPVTAETGSQRIIGMLDAPIGRRDLKAATSSLGISEQSLVLACWALGLGEVLRATHAVVNLVASNRFSADLQKMLATTAQVVPLLVDIDHGEPLADYARRIHSRSLRAYSSACYDVDQYADERRAAAEAAGVPEVMFDYGFNFRLERESVELAQHPADEEREVVWLPPKDAGPTLLTDVRLGEALQMVTVSDPAVFPQRAVEDLSACFLSVLRTVLKDPSVRLGDAISEAHA